LALSKKQAAFISIVGRANVGKSSLLNKILGQKISIVSPKPQTTRSRIKGILTRGDIQFIFIDTPGIHKPMTKLGEFMVNSAQKSIADVDACLLVVEAVDYISEFERNLVKKFKFQNLKAILAINKIDLVKDKSTLIKQMASFSDIFNFESIIPISVKTGENLNLLIFELTKLASPSEHFFEQDALTDQPERVLAAEIIREKLLNSLNQEVPHGIVVAIEKIKERKFKNENAVPLLDIDATIYCERVNHKGIIIGKCGSMLKKIAEFARFDLENFFCCKVNLQIWVKVKENWRNKESLIKNFGFNFQN
jgi:GTP-binding protein Era